MEVKVEGEEVDDEDKGTEEGKKKKEKQMKQLLVGKIEKKKKWRKE